MKNFILFSLLLLTVNLAFGQKKQLELSDIYSGKVYPKRVNSLQWIPGENSYTYVKDTNILKVDIKKNEKILFSLSKLKSDFTKANLKTGKRFPNLRWINSNTFHFNQKDSLYSYNYKTGDVNFISYYPIRAEYKKSNPANHSMTAFTKENNLYISKGASIVEVTNDNNPNIVNGQTVSRSEFGIVDGIFWSPKGNFLAFYRKDETAVAEYPLVNTDARIAEVKMIKYPMAGEKSEKVTLGIFDPTTKATVFLDTEGEGNDYLTNVTWSPDEKHIYIQVLNRAQNHMKLNKYDASNGKLVKTLFEEKRKEWVEPEEGLYFLNNSNSQFVFMSERDGYYHAYLCDTEGNILKQLTKGEWIVTSFKGFNKKNSKMYFMATKDSPIERHLYELDMKKLNIKKITSVEGTHNIHLNSSKTYFIDQYSNAKNIASEYALLSIKGKVINTILKNEDPLKDYALGEMTIDILKANDGTDLFYRLIKPANFEKGKKYPTIIYVYGGPHAQLVNNRFLGGGGYFLQHLASKGYVVFTIDNRGTANRGYDFEKGIHRQLGTLEMQDQMTGVDFLKTLDYVDTNRIGIQGWSFGGFMTTSLLLNYPETFKVGIAGGPVIDWKYYEIMYGERYMDTPQENPEGYKKANTLNKVQHLNSNLMIIHGTMDPVVLWQHSQLFVKKCVKNQKLLDYFIYPGHEHNVRGYDRMHLERKISTYFDDYL